MAGRKRVFLRISNAHALLVGRQHTPARQPGAPVDRESKDDRNIGELFYLSIDELSDVCYIEAIRLLMVLFAARLQERRLLDEGEVQDLLQGFLAELPMLYAVVTKPAKMCIDWCFSLGEPEFSCVGVYF